MPGKHEVAVTVAVGLFACLVASVACRAVARWVEAMVAALVVVQP